MADDERGAPIAYTVLREGTPVRTSDGHELGRIRRVLADEGADVFDGVTVDTADGERFVDAPEIGELYERLVLLTIDKDEARRLPEHSGAPATLDVSAGDVGGDTTTGRVRGAARRTWDRLSGNY